MEGLVEGRHVVVKGAGDTGRVTGLIVKQYMSGCGGSSSSDSIYSPPTEQHSGDNLHSFPTPLFLPLNFPLICFINIPLAFV